MSRDVVVIGAGLIGAMSAVHAAREGLRVTIVEPDTPGGEQASSYGNAGWLSSHSVIPPAQPGTFFVSPDTKAAGQIRYNQGEIFRPAQHLAWLAGPP